MKSAPACQEAAAPSSFQQTYQRRLPPWLIKIVLTICQDLLPSIAAHVVYGEQTGCVRGSHISLLSTSVLAIDSETRISIPVCK